MVTTSQRRSQGIKEIYYGQISSKEFTGGHRGLMWSHLVTGGHKGSKRSNIFTHGHRRSEALTEV